MTQRPEIFDLSDALTRSMGDVAFLRMLLDDFNTMTSDSILRLEKSIADNDMPQLGKDAHQLKGAAGNLAAGKIMAAALNLEQIGKQGRMSEAQPALNHLKAAVEEFNRHVAKTDWSAVEAA